MGKYLLIESRDPFQHNDTDSFYGIAADLAKAGNDVTMFMVQNGVLPARKGASAPSLARLQAAAPGVRLLADDFSLRERAIGSLANGVSAAPIDTLVDLLTEDGTKAIWH